MTKSRNYQDYNHLSHKYELMDLLLTFKNLGVIQDVLVHTSQHAYIDSEEKGIHNIEMIIKAYDEEYFDRREKSNL